MTTNISCKKFHYVLPLASALAAAFTLTAHATPDKGSNCSGCHTVPQDGMYVTGFQGLTNLGSGLLKVFQVNPGQTAAIQIQMTNCYGGKYGLTIDNLGGSGLNNSTDHLVYTADPTWTNRTTYFTVGPTYDSGWKLWTFNLAVQANTPADFYTVQTQMAGKDIDLNRWSQQETFYVQVVSAAAPVPPTPAILAPQRSGSNFSVRVATANGFTYYLEYKISLTAGTWSPASQTPGDGTTKTLTDSSASDSQRFYRIRVQ